MGWLAAPLVGVGLPLVGGGVGEVHVAWMLDRSNVRFDHIE